MSTNRITIHSADVVTRTEKVNGELRQFRHQVAYLHKPGAPFPDSCKIALRDNAPPYAPGDYETAQKLEINNFGELRVSIALDLQRAAPLPVAKAG